MRFLPALAVVTFMSLIANSGYAQAPSTLTKPTLDDSSKVHTSLEVIDPYVEMHTGPGRGYPIFYVIEQGEAINILTRRPDWYEVTAKGNRTGWVKASQIARTLQPTGEPVDLPSVSQGDYLKNSWRVGFSVGPLDGDDLGNVDSFTVNAGYRPLSWIGVDVEYGNFYGNEMHGDLYNLNAIVEPYTRWNLSPVIILGTGKINIDSQPEGALLDFKESSFDLYGAGLHYYIGRSFVARLEYRKYTVSTETNKERLDTWQIGFNTFF